VVARLVQFVSLRCPRSFLKNAGEWIFFIDSSEADNTAGAMFGEGGCGNTRSTLEGVELTGASGNAVIRAAYAHCVGEPPLPCQVWLTDPTSVEFD
jgi:hypothetical protein